MRVPSTLVSLTRSLLLLIATAICLTGCVAIASESARQLDEVGDVELTTIICASETGAAGTCPRGNSGTPAGTGNYQVLMAYRLPLGVTAPESVGATEGTIAFARNETFTAELNRLAPIPPAAGQRWVGYLSPSFAFGSSQPDRSATITARLGLIRGGDGSPFAGPVRYRTLVGYRESAPDPSRPVVCGETLSQELDGTRCMDAPSEEEAATDLVAPTRDLSILTGAAGSVARGASGTIDFAVGYAGEGPSPPFGLSASTSVPGGTATPSAATLAPPATGRSVIPVAVAVPASAPPGVYDVTLTAALANGQTRSATGTLTVTGADVVDRSPPEVSLRLKTAPRMRRALRIGVVADVSCSEDCTLSSELRAGRRTARALRLRIPPGRQSVVVGRVAERVHAAGRRNVRIRFTKGLGPRLLRPRRVSLALVVVARDRQGNARRRTLQFAIRR